jgi:hypothetical protein
MKRQKLIENLENILSELKNSNKEEVIIWAYDPSYNEDGSGAWIVMDGNFEMDDKNNLNIL